MTKYEWESELKKNIHRLPAEEINRVLEYYGELFADKIEQGWNEYEIVRQFGNPVDVADKILSDYDGEWAEEAPAPVPPRGKKEKTDAPESQTFVTPVQETEAPPVQAAEEIPLQKDDPTPDPHPPKRGEVRGERVALLILLNVLTGFVPFIVFGVLWIVTAALTVAFGACIIGGVVGALWSVVLLFAGSAGVATAQIGACVALAGVSMLLLAACGFAAKGMWKGTKSAGTALWRWIRPSEVKYEKN